MLKRFPFLFLLPALLAAGGCAASDRGPRRLSAAEVARMEAQAGTARSAFWQGQCEKAHRVLVPLAQEFTTSQPLYLCELASVHLAAGDEEGAFSYLREAYRLLEAFYDPRTEKRAQSLWGAEAEKVYKGDPYERCMLSVMLGSLFLERGDVDNALACFKNGQLADADVTGELYKSDFGVLQLLESRCYRLRQQEGMAEDSYGRAVESFIFTHPRLKDLVARKQGLVSERAALRNSRRGRRPQTIAAVEEKLDRLNRSIFSAGDAVGVDYVKRLSSEFNTLVFVWSGIGPAKRRTGQYGEKRVIVPSTRARLRYEVQVDGAEWWDAIQGFCDVTFQATTRGGRVMDNVLRGQADFKRATDEVGDAFIDQADDVGGEAGAVILAIGLISKGISAATTVKADIRCWKLLPDSLHLVPLELDAGAHELRIEAYDQLLKVGEWRCRVSIDPEAPLNVIWAVPGGR